MTFPDEKILLEQLAQGSEPAFAMLLDKYGNNIYSQALVYVKNTQEAQDIVQEVFMKIWEKRADLTAVTHFRSYLFIVARNHIISALRKKLQVSMATDTLELEDVGYVPDYTCRHRDLSRMVTAAVQMLPQQQQKAYLLSREQGLSHDEVAARMQVTREAAKKNISRALHFVRTFLRSHYDVPLLCISLLCY
ncbi:RNA polymerase sigma-70 factor, ECF subfamily [Filimonas lacunae]|uniref:RNA polymerase sigma factor n=2 Tax=Filimonas lacunae TaxID=477680 RepID=A0A173MIY2_9BACT|nr:RNA polymerase ECF-type sigma factor [Filimonas lacunae]SIT30292.1 RNA polymerase sigma-70 factor, ECF subfamily [Filimonas lacunae]